MLSVKGETHEAVKTSGSKIGKDTYALLMEPGIVGRDSTRELEDKVKVRMVALRSDQKTFAQVGALLVQVLKELKDNMKVTMVVLFAVQVTFN